MTPAELKSVAIEIWGERGWVSALAASLSVDRTQVWRYINGNTAVPGPVAAAATCWIGVFRKSGTRPPANIPNDRKG